MQPYVPCSPATPGVAKESVSGFCVSRRGRRVAFFISKNKAAGLPQTKRSVVLKIKWSLGRAESGDDGSVNPGSIRVGWLLRISMAMTEPRECATRWTLP